MFRPFFCAAAISVCLLLVGNNTIACDAMELKLSASEAELLRELQKIEASGKDVSVLLQWAPLVNIWSSANMAEYTLNVSTTDWETWAKSTGNMAKITRYKQKEAIDFWRLENKHSGSGQDFFDCLYAAYSR